MEREYGPYDAHSIFLTVVDQQDRLPAGVLRAVHHNVETGHKTVNDLHRVFGADFDRLWLDIGFPRSEKMLDVGTLAVRESYRGRTPVSGILYALLHQQALQAGVEHLVAVLDETVLGLLTALGVPFEPIAGTRPFSYMGSSKSISCIARVADCGPGVLAKLGERDPTARLLALGEGLPEMVCLPK